MMNALQTLQINKTETIISYLDKLIKQGGPKKFEYKYVDHLVNIIYNLIKNNEIESYQVDKIIEKCDFLNTRYSIMGHIKQKPYGYAGDFDIIEKLYQNKPLSIIHYNWDKYALSNSASIAVRNRKKYFKTIIQEKNIDDKYLDLCNVASGPARDIKELYDIIDNIKKVNTTCVELDKKAIEFAKNITEPYKDQIEFVNKNVLRFNTDKKFDVIWSAGLFDYFNDKIFVRLISRFFNWLKPGGEIVIGNFNEGKNPSRPFMELF